VPPIVVAAVAIAVAIAVAHALQPAVQQDGLERGIEHGNHVPFSFSAIAGKVADIAWYTAICDLDWGALV
jgi:hypothetical protein